MLRIENKKIPEQNSRDIRHAHRHAGMAGVCFLDSVNRQEADGVNAKLIELRGA
jgi:hypothetical protein